MKLLLLFNKIQLMKVIRNCAVVSYKTQQEEVKKKKKV